MRLATNQVLRAGTLRADLHRSIARRGLTGTVRHTSDRCVASLLGHLCTQPRGRHFGIREALAFGWRLDCWDRGTRVVDAIQRLLAETAPAGGGAQASPIDVLDIGGGNSGLASLLPAGRFRVVTLDRKRHLLRSTRGPSLLADGSRLPFRDASFTIVASTDVLEHVPDAARAAFLADAARVATLGVIVHCPVNGENGRYEGLSLDRQFQEWHLRHLGVPEPNTNEHLEAGLPTVEQVRAALPDCRIEPTQPANLWLDMMRLGRSNGRFFAGLRLMGRIRHGEEKPPFHAALFTYRVSRKVDLPPERARTRATCPTLCANGIRARR